MFIGWSGRALGKCFACDGVGSKAFKTSSETRAKARASKAANETKKHDALLAAFNAEHPGVRDWLVERAPRWDFAASLLSGLDKFGSLTDNQLRTVNSMMLKDAMRAAEGAKREVEAPAADVSKIEQAFEKARNRGVRVPKVRLGTFKFKPAPAAGNNPGAVYVTSTDEGAYLGKVLNGRFLKSRECDDATAADVIKAAADPLAAAIAYGKQFGECAICARELTDPVSIERGIGPICAGKFGW
jgi:hypothetical protein